MEGVDKPDANCLKDQGQKELQVWVELSPSGKDQPGKSKGTASAWHLPRSVGSRVQAAILPYTAR